MSEPSRSSAALPAPGAVRVAAIDVGTNSILLTIADFGPSGEIHVVDDRCRVERLGRGVDKTGVLDDAAVARALDAMREYAGAIAAAGFPPLAAIGTQALREARNGAAFLEPARAILGAPVEVIGGRREAELAFAAVLRSFPELGRSALVVVDVGGGSTELIVGHGGAVTSLTSVPIGSVRLTERHVAHDPPTADERAALEAAIDAALSGHDLPRAVPLVGTAGTATTIGAVALGLEPYDPDRVQGLRVPRAEVERQLDLYAALPVAERSGLPGLDPKRADVIAAGTAILARVMVKMDAETLIVSDRGIRFGLLAELAAAVQAGAVSGPGPGAAQ
jgi:exopolyphosphatase/guanosine-5'-triphosphate,3'-diphosphate pyrophosphatase